MDVVEIFVSQVTIKHLLEKGIKKFRRAKKEGYTFEYLAIPEDDLPLPTYHEAALSTDKSTLFILKKNAQCLFDTGDCVCTMGDEKIIRFYTEKGKPGIPDHLYNIVIPEYGVKPKGMDEEMPVMSM